MGLDEDNNEPRLWNWLQDVPPCEKSLAWCHTTTAFKFRRMAETGECKLRPCEVFSEDLLYLFYGRPAYRANNDPMSKAGSQPVVLLFEPPIADNGKRLHPFDTGAFRADRLGRWLDPDMKLSAFELKCSTEGVLRFVAAFFASNENYLRTQLRPDIKQFGGEFEASALFRMFTAAADGNPDQPADDRRMAVELQVSDPISLKSSALLAVIYPDELAQASWFKSFHASRPTDVRWVQYTTQPSKLASHYQGHLELTAQTLQKDLGIL